jgi:hypothetical protein
VVRWHGGPPSSAIIQCNFPQLSYFGGPVVQSPVIVPVLWNSSVNAQVRNSIAQFYADVTVSSYWSWLSEYDTVGLTPGTSQAILAGTSVAAVTLVPSRCKTSASCTLDDAQLQSELVAQIAAGHLPAPTTDCTGNSETIYMVHFPPNISLSGPGQSCVNGGFCAYHYTTTYGTNNVPLIYAAVMDTFTGPCATGCGTDPTALENQTDIASHELVEAVTDPDVGLDTQSVYAAPAGWGDNDNSCGEIADICADHSPGDTITVSGRQWVVQEVWSNAQGMCTSTGPSTPVCSGTTLTGCRRCSCGDSGHACTSATPVCETASGNVLFGACEACTATSATCPANTTCAQSPTPEQDDVCVSPSTPALGGSAWLLAAALMVSGSIAAGRRANA